MHRYYFLIGHLDRMPCYGRLGNTLVSVRSFVTKMPCSQHLLENTDLCHCAPEMNVWAYVCLIPV